MKVSIIEIVETEYTLNISEEILEECKDIVGVKSYMAGAIDNVGIEYIEFDSKRVSSYELKFNDCKTEIEDFLNE